MIIRVIKTHLFQIFTRLVLFAAGFLLGMAVANAVTCHRIDNLTSIQKKLELDLEEAYIKLEKLEKSNQKALNPVIKDIQIEMVAPERDFNTSNAEEYINELLRDQMGREIDEVDIELLYQVLNDRIAEFEGQRYKFRVQYILLSQTLRVKVIMQELSAGLPE